eukprot:scaffold122038_cov64-Phaeocystis_antarctica.AAC.1
MTTSLRFAQRGLLKPAAGYDLAPRHRVRMDDKMSTFVHLREALRSGVTTHVTVGQAASRN